MSLRVKLNQYRKPLYFLFSAVILFLALYTLHDLQTSEGVGLFFSILNGHSTQKLFDVFVDAFGLLLLLLSLLLPCILLKYRTLEAFYHMTVLYLALIPSISPGYLVHLPDTIKNMGIRQTFADGNYLTGILESFTEMNGIFFMLIPLLLLIIAMNQTAEPSPLKNWKKTIILLELAIFLFQLFYPAISEEIVFLLFYLLIIWIFAELEDLSRHYPFFSEWGIVLYSGFFLRSLYRLIEIMSISQV